jgi:hypothetical protein
METRQFSIVASNRSNVESQLTALSRRSIKLGLEPITFSFGKAFIERRTILSNRDSDQVHEVDRDLLILPVTITGPLTVSFEGWRFIATLQHLQDGGTVVRAVEGSTVPSRYKTSGCSCEHCGVNRFRSNTYILAHEDGKTVQVGSTCIKDFLGGNCPDDILSRANWLSEIISFLDKSNEEEFGRVSSNFWIVNFIGQALSTIRKHGWVSKAKADEEGREATCFTIQKEYSPNSVVEADKVQAQVIVDWAENLSNEACEASDYLHNLRAIARSGMVESRTAGFAASMVAAYNKATAEKSKVESQYVGEVKQKKVFQLTFKKCFSTCTQYGVMHTCLFEDASSNVFVWQTSTRADFTEGASYALQGTIKGHSEFRNVKQTMLTRCKIVGG